MIYNPKSLINQIEFGWQELSALPRVLAALSRLWNSEFQHKGSGLLGALIRPPTLYSSTNIPREATRFRLDIRDDRHAWADRSPLPSTLLFGQPDQWCVGFNILALSTS